MKILTVIKESQGGTYSIHQGKNSLNNQNNLRFLIKKKKISPDPTTENFSSVFCGEAQRCDKYPCTVLSCSAVSSSL